MTKGNTAQKERFIELRAAGLSYETVAAQLNVSKPTLISWGRELAKEVHNARTLRLDELFERFAVAKGKRVEAFGRRLAAILAELDTRSLSDVKTEVLLALALKYGERMAAEAEPLTMQGEDTAWDTAALTTRDTWPV